MKLNFIYKLLSIIGLLTITLINSVPNRALANDFALDKDPTRPELPINNGVGIKKIIKKNDRQVLQAILKKGNKYIAIIEDKSYQNTDYYLGHKIIEIKFNKVKIMTNSGVRTLFLFPKIKTSSDG